MAVETITRAAKILVKRYFENKRKQLYEVLHPVSKATLNAGFQLDKYTTNPSALRIIDNGGQSIVRQFTPGSGEIFKPYLTSEKTPIDSQLSDAVLAGMEPTDAASHTAELVDEIVNGTGGFIPGNIMQRNYAAMNLLRTGKFTLTKRDGSTESLDFGRPTANDITYNFTTTGNNFDGAIKEMLDVAEDTGIPKGSLAVIIGSSWKKNLIEDSNFLSRLQGYKDNVIAMIPEEYQNVEGLYFIGKYTPREMVESVYLFSYSPRWDYRINGGSATKFLPATEAVMFDMKEPAVRINTGWDIDTGKGTTKRVTGDLVISSFVTVDPDTYWLRAQSRYAFIRNVDQTVRCVGTF